MIGKVSEYLTSYGNRVEEVRSSIDLKIDLLMVNRVEPALLRETFISRILASTNENVKEKKEWTLEVASKIKPYFLAPYTDYSYCQAKRWINGKIYTVERYNHGLAHGLRQGMLAKDIFRLLLQLADSANFPNLCKKEPILKWAEEKIKEDPNYLKKLEMASSFQRSGRQSEVSSSDDINLYRKYELQDSINFTRAARESGIFLDEEEVKTFAESMIWESSKASDSNKDLKYLKCILQSAHMFDLRRILSFDRERIKKAGIEQLFTGNGLKSALEEYKVITDLLWNRSGEYLRVTGDRDLETGRGLGDAFFLQTPDEIVEALYQVGEISLT